MKIKIKCDSIEGIKSPSYAQDLTVEIALDAPQMRDAIRIFAEKMGAEGGATRDMLDNLISDLAEEYLSDSRLNGLAVSHS